MEQAIRVTPEAPVARSDGDDLRLLRAFEPIVRYTKGELFMPMAIEPYVAGCSLWQAAPGEEAMCIVPTGELTVARLCEESRARQDAALSLRYVEKPLRGAERRLWRRAPRDRLRASGRFTTTGMFGRLLEVGFRASLLLRGKVSAGLAAAAEISYREHREADRFVYYGHVIRDGGYACLQYWFFYAMNDWRTSFSGVNDHEADWELVTVYLAEQDDGTVQPAWVALSSHETVGDQLRRRWDDPDLRRAGNHPIVFAGAGSHSGAFVPGDYVVSVDPPQLRRIIALARRAQRLLAPWRDETRAAGGFGIPFVDYARGDGRSIGPGQDAEWTPALIDDDIPWVRAYRGLWGLDTKDPFAAERAPAGPRYERDGSVRKAWANPLGWAGLLKVPPRPEEAAGLLRMRVDSIERELHELDAAITAERVALRSLRAQFRSLDVHDYARRVAETRRAELIDREAKLNESIAARTRLADERHSYLDSLREPAPEPPQAHLTAPHGPRSDAQERRVRFLRLWAVISTPLLLAAPIVVLIASPLAWIPTIAVLAAVFLGAESIARHRFISFLGSVLLIAGVIVGLGALFYVLRNHWRILLSVMLGAAALAVLLGNLGDLRHVWLRGPPVQDEDEQGPGSLD